MTDILTLTPEDAALLLEEEKPTWESGKRAAWAALRERIEAHAKLVPPPMSTLGSDRAWYKDNRCVRAKNKTEALRLLKAAGHYTTSRRFSEYWSEAYEGAPMLRYCTKPGVWVKGPEGWVKAQ